MTWSYCKVCGTIEQPKQQVKLVVKLDLEGTIHADEDTSGKVPHKQEQKVVYVCSDCGQEVEVD